MNIIIAGGGTGGHLFPGIAIAREFLRKDPENRITFIGTKKGIEYRVLPEHGFDLKIITVKGFKGKGFKNIALLILLLVIMFLIFRNPLF